MPIFLIIVIGAVVSICLGVDYFSKKKSTMNMNVFNIITFVISLFSLIISLKLFWNQGVFADEYGSSPVLIAGGWFWLSMDWLRQGLLFILCLLTGFKLMNTRRKP